MNYIEKILYENCNTFAERREVSALTEAELQNISVGVINKMLDSTKSKANIDFSNIPQSRGNIEKYKELKTIMNALDMIEKISGDKMVKIKEIEKIRYLIDVLHSHRDLFEKGFKLKNELVILTYNILVRTCFEATSALITSYINHYEKTTNGITVSFTKGIEKDKKTKALFKHVDNLCSIAKSGNLRKSLNSILEDDKNNFTGVDVAYGIGLSIAVITALTALVPVLRELVFMYYYSRVKVSDALKQLALFVELNKKNIELSESMPVKKRDEIIKNQETVVKQLMKISDIIRVDYSISSNKSESGFKSENKNWTLGSIKTDLAGDQGVELL